MNSNNDSSVLPLPPMADRQLPIGDEIFLDHIGMFVLDPEVGAETLEKLGFRLTPYCIQTNPAPVGTAGGSVPTGTANRCAMFERGYLELLSPTSDTALSRQLRAAVSRYPGLHLAAFSAEDMDRIFNQLDVAGFKPGPAVDLRRDVVTDAGPATLRFSVVRVAPENMPEGRIQFLRHYTAELLWEDKWLQHPNGAVALTDMLMVVDDNGEVADRYERFLGIAPTGGRDRVVFSTARGRLTIVPPNFYAALPGMHELPGLPFMASCAVEVADIAKTRAVLEAGEIFWREQGDGRLAAILPAEKLKMSFTFFERGQVPVWLE